MLGNEAWVALTSEDPRALAALVRSGTPALPVMAPALHRHLRELPSVENGLRFSEQLVLEMLCECGSVTLRYVWRQLTLDRDPLPYNTDLAFLDLIQYMLAVSEPLLSILPGPLDEKPPFKELPFGRRVSITEIGRAVLRGERDWLSLRPMARWVGGVHIQPGVAGWRWDEARGEAVFREA